MSSLLISELELTVTYLHNRSDCIVSTPPLLQFIGIFRLTSRAISILLTAPHYPPFHSLAASPSRPSLLSICSAFAFSALCRLHPQPHRTTRGRCCWWCPMKHTRDTIIVTKNKYCVMFLANWWLFTICFLFICIRYWFIPRNIKCPCNLPEFVLCCCCDPRRRTLCWLLLLLLFDLCLRGGFDPFIISLVRRHSQRKWTGKECLFHGLIEFSFSSLLFSN